MARHARKLALAATQAESNLQSDRIGIADAAAKWPGQSSTAMSQLDTRWDTAIDALSRSVESLAANVTQATSTYLETDATSAAHVETRTLT
ncbi:WXG100 family type VII secretion target [Williamsia muralis]|uniref:WXG100 family type VII secretion target n=1 Tax=Williamsia marianensis TaxID=85044 RepID=A0A2G3PRC6_WILMA|nr:hypothetical protein CSW57_04005 [Williamsia marianensis]